MTTPQSFRRLAHRARNLLNAHLKRPFSDSELLDQIIELSVDNRCERLEELCPALGTLDRASARTVLNRLVDEVTKGGLPDDSLDRIAIPGREPGIAEQALTESLPESLSAVAEPENGEYVLTMQIGGGRYTMKATHPSLLRVSLPHSDLERALPFELRFRLRSEAAKELFLRRLKPALQQKVEELLLLFPERLASPLTPLETDCINPQPTDEDIDSVIAGALNSADPSGAFHNLLRKVGWSRKDWADVAICSPPTISRWIHGMTVSRSSDTISRALRQRLRKRWSNVHSPTTEQFLKN
jgi:hypothetical protein